MRFAAMHDGAISVDALMGVDHPHAGGFSHDDRARPRQILADAGNQRSYSSAANLRVIGDDEMHRLFEVSRLEQRHRSQNAGEKALHVASTASIKLAAARRERERI